MSHSYETVASILGPSSAILSEVDNLTHSDGDTTAIQNLEGQIEDNNTEYPQSAEPYMGDLACGRSMTPSPATDSDDGFLVCASIRKWPPLTEADISEISKDSCKEEEEQDADLGQWNTKDGFLIGQDSVQTSVYTENLLARLQTETGQDEVSTMSSSSKLDKG